MEGPYSLRKINKGCFAAWLLKCGHQCCYFKYRSIRMCLRSFGEVDLSCTQLTGKSNHRGGRALMYGFHIRCVRQPSCCKKWARMNFNRFLCTFWSPGKVSVHRQITVANSGKVNRSSSEIEGRLFWLMDRAFLGGYSVGSHCFTGVRLSFVLKHK